MKNILFINRVDRTSFIINLKEQLKKLGSNVGIIVASDNEFCTSKKFADDFVILPKNDKIPLETIVKEIVIRHHIVGIFAASNYDLMPLLSIKKWLADKSVNLIAPTKATVELCLSKKKLQNWLISNNIKAPHVYSYDEVLMNHSQKIFPLIIKPSSSQGSSNTFKVFNHDELSYYHSRIPNPIIQEFIQGVHYTIDCFNNEKGKPILIVPRIRLLVLSSYSVVAKIDINKNIISLSRKIANSLSIIGPLNIQLISNSKGCFVHDINPRLASGISFSINAGAPFDQYLLELLINKKITNRRFNMSDGTVYAKRYTIESFN